MEIKVNHLGYTYNNKTKLKEEVLKDINLEIKDNTIIGIIGSKASGKTTLAKVLALQKLPTDGEIQMGTITVGQKNDRDMIKNLKQQIGFIDEYYYESFIYDTVYNEIEYMLNTHEYVTLNHEKRIKDSLKIVGLSMELLNKAKRKN